MRYDGLRLDAAVYVERKGRPLADTSRVVGTSYTYEPFGRTAVSGASSTNPFGFTGRESDSTGSLALYNYRARSYSPALQRFLTEDPIGFAAGDVNEDGTIRTLPWSRRGVRLRTPSPRSRRSSRHHLLVPKGRG